MLWSLMVTPLLMSHLSQVRHMFVPTFVMKGCTALVMCAFRQLVDVCVLSIHVCTTSLDLVTIVNESLIRQQVYGFVCVCVCVCVASILCCCVVAIIKGCTELKMYLECPVSSCC